LILLEASTGIEPVYTDLQSSAFPNEINTQGPKKYQDKAGTGREPDTSAKSNLTNENPGATAIATGAKDVVDSVNSCGEYIAAFPILAMHWGALV